MLDGNFNSIKVRLELVEVSNNKPVLRFQFHKGTIRTPIAYDGSSVQAYFNSIKVRLELASLLLKTEKFINFNSIKVRLEHFLLCFASGSWLISIP